MLGYGRTNLSVFSATIARRTVESGALAGIRLKLKVFIFCNYGSSEAAN